MKIDFCSQCSGNWMVCGYVCVCVTMFFEDKFVERQKKKKIRNHIQESEYIVDTVVYLQQCLYLCKLLITTDSFTQKHMLSFFSESHSKGLRSVAVLFSWYYCGHYLIFPSVTDNRLLTGIGDSEKLFSTCIKAPICIKITNHGN